MMARYKYNAIGPVKARYSRPLLARYHPQSTTIMPLRNLSNRRCHQPPVSLWLNRDPIFENGGYNLYGYVNNAPLRYCDLLGLRFTTVQISF